MFIDTHCHLSIKDYDDIDLVIKENIDSGVNKIIVSACEVEDFEEAISLLNKYDSVYLTLGFHPSEVSKISDADLEKLKKLLKLDRVVGVGEIGLDYYYTKDNKEEQIKLFETQLALAEKYNLPVIVHSRDATEDTINSLKKFNCKGVIHSFSGSLETARIYIKMGYLLGVNGVITFKNAKIKEVIKEVGLENIILETDSPYLTPEPFRGKQNNPGHVFEIAKFIADLYNISLEELAKKTNKNIANMYKKMKLD